MQQRLPGKVERRPNLARFQNVANAVLKPGAVPAELILKRLCKENLFQSLDSLVAEKVLCRLFAVAFVAVGHVGIKVNLVSGLAIAINARKALHLPGQKIRHLEIVGCEVGLCVELNQPGFQGAFDPVQRCGFLPLVALFPALHRGAFGLQHFGNLRHGKPLPVQ